LGVEGTEERREGRKTDLAPVRSRHHRLIWRRAEPPLALFPTKLELLSTHFPKLKNKITISADVLFLAYALAAGSESLLQKK
jgi:hypothetical protein